MQLLRKFGIGCTNYCLFFSYVLRSDPRARQFMERHVNGTLWKWERSDADDLEGNIVNEQPQGIIYCSATDFIIF